ncbi:uncharacterized protein C5L36_0C07960 [Pichia kudriavzevii]|uniref:FAD dependent oxidoreductase domain-containing protein n=1 Tax=Pichia kudriavzevii TaxID=4909 RepID=A0A2U9R682_PICKU|nr:uncharacterized protein C5L36_0C07960 [Pichia kudriavzevii]AWU76882.1 hypothetical protein C5L36_0C07960 [Pichia kudriavzevii]
MFTMPRLPVLFPPTHPHMRKGVLVVGAGVVGLTTALELSNQYGDSLSITLIAKDLPGDVSPLYTSPKAGAHWTSSNSKENKQWQLVTYKRLKQLSEIPESFVVPYPLYQGDIVPEGCEAPPFEEPWYKDLVEDYEFLGSDPKKFPQVANLHVFKSYSISTTLYLVYLLSQCKKNGITIKRHTIASLQEAENFVLANGKKPDVVVNCTGLQYNQLNGCYDPKLVPVKGYVLLIENTLPYQTTFKHPKLTPDAKDGEFLMLFPRAEGGSVLGGIYDRNFTRFDTSIDADYAGRLVTKATTYMPELGRTRDIKVSTHTIGFRPERQGGARIGVDINNRKIVHNYGNGNSGYIESWGAAQSTVDSVAQVLFDNPKL